MTKKTQRFLLAGEVMLIAALLFFFRGHLGALLNPKNAALEGKPAPEIGPGVWINSDTLRMPELRGRVVLLDFWSYRCGPCLGTIPTLRAWQEEFPALVIVGVHSPQGEQERNTDNLRRAVAAHRITWPVVTDNGMITWTAYRTQLWPTFYLVDRRGVIRAISRGTVGLGSLRGDIARLLAEPA
jgi:thiol-disulfide isomerase/thioredoxin